MIIVGARAAVVAARVMGTVQQGMSKSLLRVTGL